MEKSSLKTKLKYHENWEVYLKNYAHYNFEVNGLKVYNSTNCWYIVDKENVYYDIFGYDIHETLQNLTGVLFHNVRSMYDTIREYENSKEYKKYILPYLKIA